MNDFVALLMYLEGSQAVQADVRLNELMDKAQKHVETIEAENERLREHIESASDILQAIVKAEKWAEENLPDWYIENRRRIHHCDGWKGASR